MDFRHVKALTIPEGSVKEIRIGNVSIWRKPSAVSYDGVEITTSNASNITDFYIRDQCSKTFTATYDVPPAQSSQTPAWTVSGLPSGLSAVSLSGDSLTISGVATSTGTSTVTIGVTKGSYSDSKQYTFNVTDRGFVSVDECVYSSYNRGYRTNVTFPVNMVDTGLTKIYASSSMPSTEANTDYIWAITGLPPGFSTEFRYNETDVIYIVGYPTITGTYTVTATVTRGSYSNSQTYTFTIIDDGYGVAITDTDLPTFYGGVAWSGSVTATANVPSDAGALTYYATELPDWLNLNSTTGALTGTPPEYIEPINGMTGDNYVSFGLYAERYPYRSPVQYYMGYIEAPVPEFDEEAYTVEFSAADVKNSAKVGTVIATLDCYGENFYTGGSLNGVLKWVDNDLPYQVALRGTYTANAATPTTPKFEMSYIGITDASTGRQGVRISFKLITKTIISSSNLINKCSITYANYLRFTNAYGTACADLGVCYV